MSELGNNTNNQRYKKIVGLDDKTLAYLRELEKSGAYAWKGQSSSSAAPKKEETVKQQKIEKPSGNIHHLKPKNVVQEKAETEIEVKPAEIRTSSAQRKPAPKYQTPAQRAAERLNATRNKTVKVEDSLRRIEEAGKITKKSGYIYRERPDGVIEIDHEARKKKEVNKRTIKKPKVEKKVVSKEEKEAKRNLKLKKREEKKKYKAKQKEQNRLFKEAAKKVKKQKSMAKLDNPARYTIPKKRSAIGRFVNQMVIRHKMYSGEDLEFEFVADAIDNDKQEDIDAFNDKDWKIAQNYEDALYDDVSARVLTGIEVTLAAAMVAGVITGVKHVGNMVVNDVHDMQVRDQEVQLKRQDPLSEVNRNMLIKRSESAFMTLDGDNKLLLEIYLKHNGFQYDQDDNVIAEKPVFVSLEDLEQFWAEELPDEVRKNIREPNLVVEKTGAYKTNTGNVTIYSTEKEFNEITNQTDTHTTEEHTEEER